MIPGAAGGARMGRCPCPTPATSSPTSIPPSARRSRSPRDRCASSPAPAAARPGSSRGAWPMPSRAGVVRPRDVLVVTFTDKAAGEMRARLAALGHPGVAASTFHAAALRQLRHFWPRSTARTRRPSSNRRCRSSPRWPAGLPGGYRYLAVRDLAAEIEWAKARRIGPDDYELRAVEAERDASLPPDLMAGLYRRYEAAQGAGRPDRLRGHARAHDRAHRGRSGDRR